MTNISPKYFIIDFEISVFNEIRNISPSTQINGVNFYFTQIIMKFMNENKIMHFYKTNNDFKKFIKYLLILAYVPENCVKLEFERVLTLSYQFEAYTLISGFFKKIFKWRQ
ncbi:hypothetical protein DMUE_3821 [Dictyocoela muelleri]|nr:hypothetical protein DMUE_3821 [Dictyocoela muelleri]